MDFDGDDYGDFYAGLPGQFRAVTRPQGPAAPPPGPIRALSASSCAILPAKGTKDDEFLPSPNRGQRFLNLSTPVKPSQADHTYSGIIVFIQNKGPEHIIVHGFTIGGHLGAMKIFVHKQCNVPLKECAEPDNWLEVFSGNVTAPTRREAAIVRLAQPSIVEAYTQRGFFLHAASFGDDALAYQSYRQDSIIVEDPRIRVLPAAGRCGSHPFDGGWWRGGRGLAGGVLYEAIRKVWSPGCHKEFPVSFRRTVIALLILWSRPECLLHCLPPEALFHIFEQFDYDWFEEEEEKPNRSALRRSLDNFVSAFKKK